jgi:hypothetical protein
MANEPILPEDAARGDKQPNDDSKRKQQLVRTGVAVGIGSAAIVAALLYANRGKKGDRGGHG